MSVAIPARQAREREFHNRAFAGDVRQPASKFYAVGRRARECYYSSLIAHGSGCRVLEYGCGPGSFAFELARHGAAVTGIDISDVAIAQARASAAAERLDVAFAVMDAERLTMAPGSFDLVCGRAILHHLDLDRAAAELSRVLRPGGRAIFWEPFGHNPVINLYRRATPEMRTVDEHPLVAADLEIFRRYFGKVEVRFFTLAPLLAVPFRSWPGFQALNTLLEAVDRIAFRAIPALGRYAWQGVLVLSDPIRQASAA